MPKLLTAKPCVINTFGIFANHLTKLIQRYTSFNFHVALALWAFCRVIALQQGSGFSASLQFAIFGFGWAAYQYLHVFVPVLYRQHALSFPKVIPFVLGLALGFFGLISQPISVWVVFGFVGLLTFCYALPFGKTLGLRFVPTLKVFVVALCWTTLAMLNIQALPNHLFLLVAVKAFLWMICLMLPFELRDMHKDAPTLKTLPQLLGARGVKILGAILICLAAVLAYQTVQVNTLLWVEWLMLLVLGVAILWSSPKRHIVFTSFWVEAIPIVWFAASVFVLTFG
jgi:hypothetical protein